jgi:DNA-binding HxlR family transcriptional regulator
MEPPLSGDQLQQLSRLRRVKYARRLKHLTRQRLFERRLYHKKPDRYEYVLTQKCRDFFPVAVGQQTSLLKRRNSADGRSGILVLSSTHWGLPVA